MNNPFNAPDTIKALKGVPPAASAAGTVNGAGIDRMAVTSGEGYLACVLKAHTGAATGAPTTQTLDVKLQDSADNSSFADYKPDGTTVAAVPQITAVNSENHVNVDLRNARRYIRAVAVTAFTGGTSPTLASAVDVILCGGAVQPTPSYS
jgi:hypothetical protein